MSTLRLVRTRFTWNFRVILVLLVGVHLGACQDDVTMNHPSLLEKQWKVVSVVLDGKETTDFDGMIVGFSPNTYSTNMVNNEVWPADGQYLVEGKNQNLLIRDDNNEIYVRLLTESQLRMALRFVSPIVDNARSKPVEYEFVFEY